MRRRTKIATDNIKIDNARQGGRYVLIVLGAPLVLLMAAWHGAENFGEPIDGQPSQ